MNMAIEGEGIRKPAVVTRKQNDVTSPRGLTVSKHRDTTSSDASTGKPAMVPRPKELASESSNAKKTSFSRPKETRNVISSSLVEAVESCNLKKRDGKNATRKPEGSWAMGCICPAQSIPIATTFCTTEDGKLKGLIARGKMHYSGEADAVHGVRQRAPRAMKIPKAVLKYSSDTSMRQPTQLPISIGPDNNGKHF